MKRMTIVMKSDDSGSGSDRFECSNCHIDFPNKTTVDRHMLFCNTLTDIRRGGGVSLVAHQTLAPAADDQLFPTPREMFILIQELAAKYNKVKDELDVMKQWAKMVGRKIGSGAAGGGTTAGTTSAGIDFTSVTRQKRQNMEVILNEDDAEHPHLAELRPSFTEWLTSSSSIIATTLTEADLMVVFNEDLVAGITAAILHVLAEYTAETGRSHLLPFKLADIKQGSFYIYDTAFGVAAPPQTEIGLDPPMRLWRAMEPCEFQLFVGTFRKQLSKEFKKWSDANWEAQRELMKQRQNAASSYQQVMSSIHHQYQSTQAMATGDGMYPSGAELAHYTPTMPITEIVLSDDFGTIYNKYAEKMMGGALSDETILLRVKTKLWKDMKAWRL